MPKHEFGYPLSADADGEAASSEMEAFAAALDYSHSGDSLHDDSHHEVATVSASLVPSDQLARDFAEIERVSAALRKAEPALETWTDAPADALRDDVPAAAMRKPRPVWLLIGLLWLSTALVTVGAVAAIARLVG
jgi:hypothetical protein